MAALGGFQESGASGTTILDLNPDCWRAVLDYLDVAEIVRSERVSRGWRQIVRDYLPGVHNFKIETDREIEQCDLLGKCGKFDNYRRLTLRSKSTEMLKKMGPFIKSLIWSNPDKIDFISMEQYCPNLEHLTFISTTDYFLPLEKMMSCKQLKRVVFVNTDDNVNYYYLQDAVRISMDEKNKLQDAHLAYIIRNEAIEELVLNGSYISGLFLTNLRSTNMKSLMLYHCSEFELACVFAAVDYLVGLTRLHLCNLSKCNKYFSEICWLLERLPNLEHLALDGFSRTPLRDDFIDAVSRLKHLKHLSFVVNENVDDEWLEQVVRGCKELRSLNIPFCSGVSGRGLVALCHARPTLTELIVTFNDASDEELAACIEACHGLTLLDVTACQKVTPRLVALASVATSARAHRLRLCVRHTAITQEKFGPGGSAYDRERLRGLILHWSVK